MLTTRSAVPTPGRPRRLRRTAALAACAAAVMVTLSGCIKLDMDLTVQSDDTVDGAIIFAFDKKVIEALGQDPKDVFDQNSDGADAVIPGAGDVTTEVYDEGGKYGQKVSFTGAPLESFGSDGTGETGDELKIVREGEFFVLTGTLDLSDAAGGGPTESPDAITQQIIDSFEVRVAVTFPGAVVESNGEVDGATVVWTPKPGDNLQLTAKAYATDGEGLSGSGSGDGDGDGDGSATGQPGSVGEGSAPASSTSPVLPWAIAALALLALAALGVFLLRRGAKKGAVSPIDAPRAEDPFLLGGQGAPAAAEMGRPDLAGQPQDTVVLPDGVPTQVVPTEPPADPVSDVPPLDGLPDDRPPAPPAPPA